MNDRWLFIAAFCLLLLLCGVVIYWLVKHMQALVADNKASGEAHHEALEVTRTLAADVEYWPTPDPTGTEGSREQKLVAYREVCDGLLLRIRKRFSKVGAASG